MSHLKNKEKNLTSPNRFIRKAVRYLSIDCLVQVDSTVKFANSVHPLVVFLFLSARFFSVKPWLSLGDSRLEIP